VQDLGRDGLRALGVPPAGAMDPEALFIANLMVGNPPGAAGLEWGLGAGRFRFEAPARCCVIGEAEVTADDERVAPWTVVGAAAGLELQLGVPGDGRFAYLAVAGGLDLPAVLGSRSTYLPGRFGGLDGRPLRTGDTLPVGRSGNGGETNGRLLPAELRPERTRRIRILEGPQRDLFSPESWERFLGENFAIASASDRMGYRLAGPPLEHAADPAMPSEPVCPGAVQVPQGAPPIVLMPDGPTVGGYPKLAVVISSDLGKLAQLRPGDRPCFTPVTLEEALAARRLAAERLNRVRRWIAGAR
jgi:biotin-dependent carboxylase-like uncharacterized protein